MRQIAQKPSSVLITGASTGLGLEAALTLASRGFNVWAGLRDMSRKGAIDDAARQRGLRIRPVYLDVTDKASIRTAVGTVLASSGHLYGVVNNAGMTVRGYFEDLSEEEIQRVFAVNLFGAMSVVREVLPAMRAARQGRIVMMSSIAGRIGSMALTAYVASKFGLEGFSESLALELAPLGVQVVLIEPGIVKTPIWDKTRRVAAGARNAEGPYYQWFCRAEELADGLVETSTLTPADVARTVVRAMTAKRPRLRYMIGRRAGLVFALRRYLPGELFERIYFGEVLRRVTGRRGLRMPAP